MSPDAIKVVNSQNIGKLIEKGVHLEGNSVNPPKTLISHTAMMVAYHQKNLDIHQMYVNSGEEKVKLSTLFHDAMQILYI